MDQQIYEVEGRQFRTKSDYARALHDKKIIQSLRESVDWNDIEQVQDLFERLKNRKYEFFTILGDDFLDETQDAINRLVNGNKKKKVKEAEDSVKKENRTPKKTKKTPTAVSAEIEQSAQEVLERGEIRRKRLMAASLFVAIICLGYFSFYTWQHQRTRQAYEELVELKEKPSVIAGKNEESGPLFHLDTQKNEKEVLEEYKNLLIKNKRLIGWVKIDDTNIDYPVVQTVDNEYYLDHNLSQEYDKNGSIFMDKDCDVLKPSTNYIIYGHHMRNGGMFGQLDKYQREEYWKEHPYILFDTIYEKGKYEVMYVFRSKVYSEEQIVFKYYQFIDAGSEQEFDSYMREMDSMSLYNTGVTAEYGDQLLTLSTCDYQEKNGRFVVVAKRIKE